MDIIILFYNSIFKYVGGVGRSGWVSCRFSSIFHIAASMCVPLMPRASRGIAQYRAVSEAL